MQLKLEKLFSAVTEDSKPLAMLYMDMRIAKKHPDLYVEDCPECFKVNEYAWASLRFQFGKHKRPGLLPKTCGVHSGITFQQRLTAACSLDANMLAMHPRYATDPTADPLISRPVCNAADLVRRTVIPHERRVIEYDDYRPILDSLADYALRV